MAVGADLKQSLKNRFPLTEQATLQRFQSWLPVKRLPLRVGKGPLETGVVNKYIELVLQKIVKTTQSKGEGLAPSKIY